MSVGNKFIDLFVFLISHTTQTYFLYQVFLVFTLSRITDLLSMGSPNPSVTSTEVVRHHEPDSGLFNLSPVRIVEYVY